MSDRNLWLLTVMNDLSKEKIDIIDGIRKIVIHSYLERDL